MKPKPTFKGERAILLVVDEAYQERFEQEVQVLTHMRFGDCLNSLARPKREKTIPVPNRAARRAKRKS